MNPGLARRHEQEEIKRQMIDEIVIEGLRKLGGTFQGRVMDLRKLMTVTLGEHQIKRALKRLTERNVVLVEPIRLMNNGRIYRLIEERDGAQ